MTHWRTLQVMWRAERMCVLPAHDDHLTLEVRSNGALIFGHEDSLQHYLPDLRYIPLLGRPPHPSKELKTIDSGIGSSLGTLSSLGRVYSRSTLSSFDHPQLTPTTVEQEGCFYGDSSMSGSYGVLGNNSGDLSVTQYCGMVRANSSTLPKSQATFCCGDSISKQAQRADSSFSLALDRSLNQILDQQIMDIIDNEFEPGRLEIRAFGLEEY